MLLTIVIPTYKRVDYLRKTITLLLPQLNNNVELVVLNNDPNTDLKKNAIHEYDQVRIINNKYNIGGNANILKCLEIAEGEYVWVLGDDDIPDGHSINNILEVINKGYDYVCFSSLGSEVKRDIEFKSISQMFQIQKNIQNYVYISTNVYKTSVITDYLEYGYHFTFTCTPILNCLLLALNEKELNCMYSVKKIINGIQQSERGNPLYAVIGIDKIRLLPVSLESSRYINLWVDQISKHWFSYIKYLGFQYLYYLKLKNYILLREQITAASMGVYKRKILTRFLLTLFGYIFKSQLIMKLIIKLISLFIGEKNKIKLKQLFKDD